MAGADPRISINVLGDFTVLRDGEAIALPPSKKTRALLAYLAVSERAQRRERLCEIFWDVPDDPRGALRWSLSKLRQILKTGQESPIEADRNTVALRKEPIRLDLDTVTALAKADLAECALEDLEEAAGAFKGRFLADLSLPRCPDFEAWRVAHTDELEFAQVRLLGALVDRLHDQPARALPYARTLQALRPDDSELQNRIRQLGELARKGGTVSELPPTPAAIPRGADRPESLEPPASLLPRIVNVGDDERPQEIRYCTTPDGVRIAYAVTGEGPPVVRAAHWMSHLEYDWNSPVWRHWMDALSDGMRLVRYDERGNGMSERDVEDLSFEAMIADLEAIVDAAGLEKFTLFGVSQSCAVSIAYAVRHPERVSGLILYGGYAKGWRKRHDQAEVVRREAMSALIREGWGQDQPIFRQIFTSMFIPGATREQMDWFNELQRITVTPEAAARFQAAFGDIDVTDLLAKVPVPTLVMHCRGDAAVPLSAGLEVANGIPGARFVELDSPNHILLAHEPAFARFREEVSAFVKERSSAAAPPAPELTRKQITALSAEIISPLQVLDGENLEQIMKVLDPMLDLACETVERHGGSIVSSGDFALTGIWGAPVATEDHAYRACRAALAIKKNLESTSQGQARVRIGLDTGDAIIRPQRGNHAGRFDTVSNVVRRAGQLCGSLKRDIIVATDQTRNLVGGYMRMERLEGARASLALRGERTYELVAENRALSRWHLRINQGLTRLIGRNTELTMLGQSWQRAREGHGQLVGIVADPGVGKSRLSHEFLASEALRPYTILECGALEFDANVSFRVIKTMLQSLFGLDDGVDETEASGIVSAALRDLGADDRLAAPISFALELSLDDERWLNLDAADRVATLREAVKAVLQLECRRRPVVLLVEDLHWLDAESEGVLNHIVDGIASQRILIIATYRPEYVHNWWQKGFFQQIRLDTLSSEETRDFLGVLLGSDPSVDHLQPILAEKTDGTPLFLEEMIRMLAETGRLSGEPGNYVAPERITDIQIPPSVNPVIAARIDKLSQEDRRVLQVAAVIGKDVPRPILKALSGLKRLDLDAVIGRLKDVEFLFELQSYPEVEYTFKHALTHDVAYESLLSEDRKRIHAEALDLMERLYRDQIHQQIERLADHALRAENWDSAAKYLLEATDRALDRSAFSKATQFLDHAARAVDSLERTPERVAQAIDIRTRMRPAYEGIDKSAEAIRRLDEAEILAEEIGDTIRLEQVLLHKSYAYSTHGRLDQAIEAADRLRGIAVDRGDDRFAAEADLAAAQGMVYRNLARPVIERLKPHVDNFTGAWRMDRFGLLGTRSVFYLGYMSKSAALLGDFEQARAMADAMNAVVEESGRPIDRYAAAFHESTVHIVAGPDRAYEQHLAAMAEECRIRAPSPFYSWLIARLGHVRLLLYGPDDVTELLDEAIAVARRCDMPHIELHAGALRAIADGQMNGPEALPSLTGNLEAVRRAGNPWLEVLMLRAISDVTPFEEAMKHLDAGEAIAVDQGYRPDEARVWAARAEIAEFHDPEYSQRAAKTAQTMFNELGLRGESQVLAGRTAVPA